MIRQPNSGTQNVNYNGHFPNFTWDILHVMNSNSSPLLLWQLTLAELVTLGVNLVARRLSSYQRFGTSSHGLKAQKLEKRIEENE